MTWAQRTENEIIGTCLLVPDIEPFTFRGLMSHGGRCSSAERATMTPSQCTVVVGFLIIFRWIIVDLLSLWVNITAMAWPQASIPNWMISHCH